MTVHWAARDPAEEQDPLPFDPDDIAQLLGHPDCTPTWQPRRRKRVITLPDIATWQEPHHD